jgi:hypothetical protein
MRVKEADYQQRFTGARRRMRHSGPPIADACPRVAAVASRQRSPRGIYATRTFQVGYFVTMRRGGDGVGAAGEITNVTHVFQPSGRFSAANSL